MKPWQRFRNFKQRGEWVELLFMAEATLHGFHVSKPWGDTAAYDVGIEQRGALLRVQVKSSSARKGDGYLCRLRHGGGGDRHYRPDEVDLFAAYILPADAWYLIPAAAVFHPTRKMNLRFYPDGLARRGRHDHAHDYEHYHNAWGLLGQPRHELAGRQ